MLRHYFIGEGVNLFDTISTGLFPVYYIRYKSEHRNLNKINKSSIFMTVGGEIL